MEISKEISTDIIVYLQKKKGQSVNDIATSMSTSPEFIQFVIEEKLKFTTEHINTYLKNKDIKFWEFAIEAIPIDHIPEKSRKKMMIYKQMADLIKKKKI